MTPESPVLAEVVRGDLVESRHRGDLVALAPSGRSLVSLGAVDRPTYPRSCAKPLQLAAMLDLGLDRLELDDSMLAVAAASHSGEPMHVEQVRRILAVAGLTEADLQNTRGMPMAGAARRAMTRAGEGPDSLHHNCSGKHAAMMATCVAAGWPVTTYRSAEHPLQLGIRQRIEAMASERVSSVTVDGCGAALFSLSVLGLARAFLALVNGTGSEATVCRAMRAHPMLVGGTGRDVTELMQAVDGLVAKDGAEGVYAVAAPAIGAIAVKIEDGAARPRVPVIVEALRSLGISSPRLDETGHVDVLGHDEPVGFLRPTSSAAAN